MSATGPNLPVVIQQVGKASLVQDAVQRAPEAQQAAAQLAEQQRQERERTTVQQGEPSGAQNRVRADDRHKQRGDRQGPGSRQAKGRRDHKDKEQKSRRGGPEDGGLVDLVV